MTDASDFWLLLARRINRELRSQRDNSIRFLWIDVIFPDDRAKTDSMKYATALLSEDDGKTFVNYRLTISLGPASAERFHCGERNSLIPAEDSSDWLSINRATKEIAVTLS